MHSDEMNLPPWRVVPFSPYLLTEHRERDARGDRILLIEDDVAIREIMAGMLQAAGYYVRCAENGYEGWDALCEERFDGFITDHNMPELTGLELLRRARADAVSIPVLFISGDIPWHEPDLLELLVPGLVMEKPFTARELLANVRRMLTEFVAASRR